MSVSAIRTFVRDRFGLVINRVETLYPWQTANPRIGIRDLTNEPIGAANYLRADNPRLLELAARYAQCDTAVTRGSVWTPDKITPQELLLFRGDNPWVFQQRMRSGNELAYALTYYNALVGREGPLLRRLDEDDLFGAYVVQVDGRPISRDLLDSAGEIAFLKTHAGLGGETSAMIDIGAGYGRLPYRIAELEPNVTAFATDAFAVSSFICEYYLNFRRSRAAAVPLDQVDAVLSRVQLATNVHSFSECRPEAIHWWTSRLVKNNVRYLMIIPNRSSAAGRCLTNDNVDMDAIFEASGYRLIVRSPRYTDPAVQRYGVDPCLISLFELS